MYIFHKGKFVCNVLNKRTQYSKSKNPQFSVVHCKHKIHAFVLGTMLNDSYITKIRQVTN